jgi:hypothetical protein
LTIQNYDFFQITDIILAMKIYIAAKFDKQDEVSQMGEVFTQEGHVLMCDWTKDTPIARPYDLNSESVSERAQRDLDNVRASDIFILLTENKGGNKGMYVELGAAIDSFLEHGKPKVFVVGDYIPQGFFFFHPVVNRRLTIEEVLNEIMVGGD